MDSFFNKNKKTVKKSFFSGTSGNDDGDQGVPRAKFYSPGNQGVKNDWELKERETLPVASLSEGGVIFPQKTGMPSFMDGTLPPRARACSSSLVLVFSRNLSSCTSLKVTTKVHLQ